MWKLILEGLSLALLLGSFSVSAESDLGKVLVHAAFTETERQVMQRYFGGHETEHEGKGSHEHKKGKSKGKGKGKGKKGLPPGLAKKGKLPPGLAKRETLPPGLSREPLPADLARELPPLRQGLERVIVDGSVVLIEEATGTVLDILEHMATSN